jgi:hypothetical protein
MGGFGGALGSANFQEPSSPDPTSAPPLQIPQQPAQQQPMQGQGGGLAQALARRRKIPGAPTMRNPAPLAAAIAKSKRARPSSDKYG